MVYAQADTEPPTGTTSAPSDGSSIEPDPLYTIAGTVIDALSGVRFLRLRVERLDVTPALYWNGTAWQASPSGTYLGAEIVGEDWSLQNVDLSQEGSYRVRFYARDNAGNQSRPNDNISDFNVVVADTTPPDGETTSPAGDEAILPDPFFTIAGTVTDEGSGVRFLRARVERHDVNPVQYWNGNVWQESAAGAYRPTEITADEWALQDVDLSQSGSYKIRFYARDNEGNQSAPGNNVSDFTVLELTEDTTPPVGVTTTPSDGTVIEPEASFTIAGTVSDEDSGVRFLRARIERRDVTPVQYWNGIDWQESAAGTYLGTQIVDEDWSLAGVDLSAEGSYRVLFSTQDNADNLSPPGDNISNFTVQEVPITIANVGQGTLDSDRVAGPKQVNLNFDSLAATEHTITVTWDSNADIRFKVRDENDVDISPTISGTSPGSWTGLLAADTRYSITIWSVSGIANFTATIEANVPVSIVSQPSDLIVDEGNNADFAVEATGSGILSYKWFADGVRIPGENAATLTVFNTTQAENGTEYTVEVSNGYDTTLSDPAVLVVNPPVVLGLFAQEADNATWIIDGPAPTLDYQAGTDSEGWGRVLLRIDDLLLVGGDFTGIKRRRSDPTTARPFMAALDAVTGLPVSTFQVPPDVNSVVRSMVLSPDGDSVYVGGDFGLLSLDATTGQLEFAIDVTDGNDPGRVFDIDVTNTHMYVGGDFNEIAGSFRANIARLTLNGALDGTWTPQVTNGFSAGRSAPVQSLTVSSSGDKVYIGGNFQAVDGTPVDISTGGGRVSMFALSALDGSVEPERFSANVGGNSKGLTAHDIAVTEDYVIVAWGGPNYLTFHSLDGTLLRQYSAKGDVQALQVVGSHVFVGHHGEFFGFLPNQLPAEALQSTNPDVVVPYKFHSFRIDDNGVFEFVQAWRVDGPFGVWGIAAAEDSVWIAGEILKAGTNERRVEGLARFPALD